MALPHIPLTKQDFDRNSWQSNLPSNPRKGWSDYFQHFAEKAREAKVSNDLKTYAVFTLLSDLTYPTLRLNGKDRPFEPLEIFEEISQGYLDALAEVIAEVSDPKMEARIADVLWIRTGNYPMVIRAIDAYLEVARFEEDPEEWPWCVQCIERAFRLAASVDQKKKGPFAKVIAHVENILERYQGEDPKFLSAHLMELMQEHCLGDANRYAAFAHKAAIGAETCYEWHRARAYWKILAKWRAMTGDEEGARSAQLAEAESYVKEAERATQGTHPSYFVASAHLEDAIHAFRSVEGTAERVVQLRKQLEDYQMKSRPEFKPIFVPLDPNVVDMAREQAVVQVKSKPFKWALFEFAFIASSPHVEDLQKFVEDMARVAPLQDMLSKQLMNSKLRTTARSTLALSGEEDARKVALREKMFTHARTLQSGQAHLVLEPAREQISKEHNITDQSLLPFVYNNPFVPSGREKIYAKGLAAGFAGDFLTAIHLLIPQLENSIRHLLAQQGNFVTNFTTPGGIQDEQSLNKVFEVEALRDELVAILGEDITFDLEGLLIERFGSNMRNEVAHGLLDENQFGPGIASYIWWITFKLCFYFWLFADREDSLETL